MAPHFRDEFMTMLEDEIGLRKRHRNSIEHARLSFSLMLRGAGSGWCHPVTKCRSIGDAFRNEVLYALYPYDRTVWAAMRRPLWWVVLVLRGCPLFGIGSLSFACLLCIIDRTDHYQLIQFILAFKKFQFLISG